MYSSFLLPPGGNLLEISKEITFIFILSLFLHFIKCSLDLKVELSFLLD